MKKIIENLGKTKFIIIIVAVLLAIIIIPTSISCIVNHESPAQAIADTFTPSKKQIVGKWQGDTAVTAYEFYDDGTYDSYISNFQMHGKYEVKGNKVTLTNGNFSSSVEYKFSIKGNKLTMKASKENGIKTDDKAKLSYTKVDTITMKSIGDLLNDLKDSNKIEE